MENYKGGWREKVMMVGEEGVNYDGGLARYLNVLWLTIVWFNMISFVGKKNLIFCFIVKSIRINLFFRMKV